MKTRAFSPFSISILAVLVLTVVWSVYWFGFQSSLTLLRGAPISEPVAAMFVPKDAPLVMSLFANPQKLQNLRQLRTPLRKRGKARAEFDRLKRSLLADTDLNYERDIKPWLGNEITLAVTTPDLDRDPKNGTQPGYLLALEVKDAEQSREFLDLFWQNKAVSGRDLQFEQYKGVKLIYSTKIQPPSRDGLQLKDFNPFAKSSAGEWSSAVVGDRFVLFANAPEVLRKAINDVQVDDLNLNGSPTYRKALDRMSDRRIGLILGDVPQLAAWLGGESVRPDSQLPDTLAVGLTLSRKGLVADTVWASESDESTVTPQLDRPVAALNYIPENSALVIAGRDLDTRWNRLSNALSGDDLFSRLVSQPLSELESRWGISLPEDIFSWVEGEYALALLPGVDLHETDWLFVAEDSDAADASMQKLDDAALEKGYSVGPFTLKDQHRILAWTRLVTKEGETAEGNLRLRLEADVMGVRGQIDNYRILASSIEAIDRAVSAPRRFSLLSDKGFSKKLGIFPTPNDGYLYLNWENGKQPIKERIPFLKVLELAGKPALEHIRSLTTSTYGSENGVRRAEVLFEFSP
ncbi:hypothetical protein AY599_16655 [Leptolyngbya valderiana BDU 20041]|nr:DUF3352 domain-containing protein [Geitlerinema sp. CS-897]OAB63346.1 hypothetical protein AY599_16655 [Leptolyngbya valderiana BDU 20041]PPT05694.1 hypothetical protein CKA32_003354 [Geitlerinema sp. FC II]